MLYLLLPPARIVPPIAASHSESIKSKHSSLQRAWNKLLTNFIDSHHRGELQSQCRPVHRGQPAHTQCMHGAACGHIPSNRRPTVRSHRGENRDAKIRGTRDDVVRLRHVELARVPLQHAAPSPPQLTDSLHHLANEQSHRPPTFRISTYDVRK